MELPSVALLRRRAPDGRQAHHPGGQLRPVRGHPLVAVLVLELSSVAALRRCALDEEQRPCPGVEPCPVRGILWLLAW